MNTSSSNSTEPSFLNNICEVVIEANEEHEQEQKSTRPIKKSEKESNKNHMKRQPQQKVLRRQVSLETGVAVLKRDSKLAQNEKKSLPRSGRSFGAYGYDQRIQQGRSRGGDFNMFRTKSGLTKQNSMFPLRKEKDYEWNFDEDGEKNKNDDNKDESVNKSVPVGRYFAALTGPELDQVKDSEDILLPKDEQWPFLLRFPIGCFGICLGLSSQAILWQALATSRATKFLHITPIINLILWLVALLILILVSTTYILKCIFYFEAVKREYFHPVRVNFFFAPSVVCMFLAISVPRILAPEQLHPALWCTFIAPLFVLELKIYGQWLSGGKRRLCKVANPSSHLSVVGNFVGAILAAKVGWHEAGKFLWAIGFAHYLVVFVTLYQRLPTSETLPKELHPVYSMFIATPAAASIAWTTIYGEFDGLARTCYFIALFLYISLVVRITFFTGFKFSVAWWSYTFPMTTVSIATIKYAEVVPGVISKCLALSLSAMSSTMVLLLFVSTLLHAFYWRTLFPNDLAIAITKRRLVKDTKPYKKAYDIRRWAKQTPLSFVSTNRKNESSMYVELDEE